MRRKISQTSGISSSLVQASLSCVASHLSILNDQFKQWSQKQRQWIPHTVVQANLSCVASMDKFKLSPRQQMNFQQGQKMSSIFGNKVKENWTPSTIALIHSCFSRWRFAFDPLLSPLIRDWRLLLWSICGRHYLAIEEFVCTSSVIIVSANFFCFKNENGPQGPK